jgi:hypothetical protein
MIGLHRCALMVYLIIFIHSYMSALIELFFRASYTTSSKCKGSGVP